MTRLTRLALALLVVLLTLPGRVAASTAESAVAIRGKAFTLRWEGPPSGDPILVLSGDGGWVHLGPQAAQFLAGLGYRVAGFDTKDYLERFTEGRRTLTEADVPRDLKVVIEAVARDGCRPILVGVSEGAGLAVLAASHPDVKGSVRGVIGLGLGDLNELGWRLRDAIIYLTKGMPAEPTFRVTDHVASLAPLPLAAIASTRDEFVPAAEVLRVMAAAREPKRLWIVPASDHRFSDNQRELQARLVDAIAWVHGTSARVAAVR